MAVWVIAKIFKGLFFDGTLLRDDIDDIDALSDIKFLDEVEGFRS